MLVGTVLLTDQVNLKMFFTCVIDYNFIVHLFSFHRWPFLNYLICVLGLSLAFFIPAEKRPGEKFQKLKWYSSF